MTNGVERIVLFGPPWFRDKSAFLVTVSVPEPEAQNLDAYIGQLLAIHPVGPPERCVRRLGATVAATGVRHLLLMVEAGGVFVCVRGESKEDTNPGQVDAVMRVITLKER